MAERTDLEVPDEENSAGRAPIEISESDDVFPPTLSATFH